MSSSSVSEVQTTSDSHEETMGSCTSPSFDVVSGKDGSHSMTGSSDECVVESGLNSLIWFYAVKLSAVIIHGSQYLQSQFIVVSYTFQFR